MWGLATTFYMLITGNYPDSMGRVAYNLPENSSEGFTAAEKAQWAHWHRCILRATAEKPSERFIRLEDFLNAILATDFNSSLEYNQSNVGLNKTHKKLLSIICALCAFIGFIVYFIWHSSEKIISEKLSEDEQNIAVLKTIDPKFETVYREGLIIENATAVIDGLEVSIGRIELMSYNDWQEDYKKKQLDYQNKLARIRTASEAESSSREFQQLQRNVDADKFFYEYDTPPSFRKYQKYIDMTLNPQKYTF